MRKRLILILSLLCVFLGGCSQISAIKDKIGGGGDDSPPPIADSSNYTATSYADLKTSLGEDTLKQIRKVVKKKNDDAFWDEFLYTVEVQANNVIQATGLVDLLNQSNVSLYYEPTTQTVTALISGFSAYSLPQDSIELCYGQVTGDKEYPYNITMADITVIDSWFNEDVFWKFWEDEDSKDIAEEYINVVGDPYAAKAYTYKAAQKIFNAFQLLPEEYRSSDNLRFTKDLEKYYIDFYTIPDGKSTPITFHIMQLQVDTDNLINCLKDVDVASYFKVDEELFDINGKTYSVNIDDYKEVSVKLRYNETMYLDTAITNLSGAVTDEVLKGKIIDVLNYVRENVESHHRIMLSINKDYPKFQYLALQNDGSMDTTIFAVNESDIDPVKSVEEQYLCNGTKLFEIDATGKYRNYLNKAQNALYYDYYKWSLPPDDLGGDDEGDIVEPKNPVDVIEGDVIQ